MSDIGQTEGVDYRVKSLPKLGISVRARPDVKTLQKENQRLSEVSMKDPLTGVGNFRALEEWLEKDEKMQSEQSSANERRSGKINYPTKGVIVFLDADGLGEANKTSHEAGDKLLSEIAKAAKKVGQRPLDEVFRRGDASDEFLIMLPGDGKEHYSAIEEKFKSALENASASLAIGTYGDGKTAREAYVKLDEALSHDKARRPKGQHVDTIYL